MTYRTLAAGAALFLALGCSSDDDEKETQSANVGGTRGGGEGGSSGSSGNGGTGATAGTGASSSGGAAGTGGEGGTGAASGSGGVGGTGAVSGAGGTGATGGAAGAGGSTGGTAGVAGTGGTGGAGCPTGTGECDGNPATVCETDLTLITSCGSCTNSCNGNNATVECQTDSCVITECTTGFGDCDDDPSTGCEEPLASNDNHCGACGRDCAAAGSTCDVDKCEPVTLHTSLPIGSDNSNALSWAFGDGAFFQVGYFNYTVRRMEADGSATSDVWGPISAAAGRWSLIANDTDVIWTQRGTPSVVLSKPHTAAPSDPPTLLFTPEFQPYFLQVHGNAYYWMSGDYQSGDTNGYVYTRSVSAPQSDPGARIVNVNQGIHGEVRKFTVSDDALYWYTTNGGVHEVRTTPLSGGTPTVVPLGTFADGFTTHAIYLRTHGTSLYYNHDVGTSFLNGIYRWNPGDSTPTQIVSFEDVRDFVVDDDYIYFFASGKTRRVPIGGGAAPEDIADVAGTFFLHQDADSLYFSSSTCCVTNIIRVLK